MFYVGINGIGILEKVFLHGKLPAGILWVARDYVKEQKKINK